MCLIQWICTQGDPISVLKYELVRGNVDLDPPRRDALAYREGLLFYQGINKRVQMGGATNHKEDCENYIGLRTLTGGI